MIPPPSALPRAVLWKDVTMWSPRLRSDELDTPKEKELHKLFGILQSRRFVYSLPFISHSYLSVWTHRHLYNALGYNLILLRVFCSIVLALAIENSFSCLLCPFDIPDHCGFGVWGFAFELLLALQDI